MSFRYSDLIVDVWAANGCPDPSRPPCPAPSKQCPSPSKKQGREAGSSLPALQHQLRQSLHGIQVR